MAGMVIARSPVEVSDEGLAAAARGGDRQAFDTLVGRYRDMTYAYALARLQSREEAEDVTQEAFVRALLALHRFRLQAAWAPWLMRIVRNLCNDSLRRRRVRASVMLDELILDLRPTPEAAALSSARRAELLSLVAAMPEKLRTPLLMHHASGRTYREIAIALGLPESTVVGRMAGALRFLRKRMVES